MTNNIEDKISIVAREIAKDGNNVVFTGAGISTESGIPDFRSKGGIWDKYRPIYFDEFMSSKEARIEYWKRHAELYPDLMKARPNPAHMAVAQLYEMGLLEAVITQNIDGLHQDSGIPGEQVIELHGNTRRVRCMSCRKLFHCMKYTNALNRATLPRNVSAAAISNQIPFRSGMPCP